MAKRMRDDDPRSPSISPPSSPMQGRRRQDSSLARTDSSETVGDEAAPELGDFFGPLGAFSVGTTRPAAISPKRRRKKSCPRPVLASDDAASIPVLQVYLNVSGNLQPGAAAMKESLKGELIPFVPAMVDQTLKRPNIFFMPTVKFTTGGLRAEGSEPMQVLDSVSYYSRFLKDSAPADPCEPTRPKLFDNVKHNLDYVKGLYLPIGGKIMLPQVLPGRAGVQGYELYRIDSVTLQPLELPASASASDSRQTVISDLLERLREKEKLYEEARQALEATKNDGDGHTQAVAKLDATMAAQNSEMERINSRMKTNKALVNKLLDRLTKQQATNETRVEDLRAAIEQLAVKFPEPRNPLQDSRYTRERDSLQARLNSLTALQKNYQYYLDENDDLDWGSDSFVNRERATQTMKEYAEAKKAESTLEMERVAITSRATATKDQVRSARLMRDTHLGYVDAADTRVKEARTELFKAQEELNAAKGGWLIDRVQGSGSNWWVVTKNGYAFPRVYNALFDIRVTYIGDEGEGLERFWGLDCRGKADVLDRRIGELIGRNPDAPLNIFKDFIQAYEPPWSPFASPAAFTSEGRRTAQTQEAKAQLARARQAAQRDDAQARAIRATLGQRLGVAAGHDRPLTLNELRAYGVSPNYKAPVPSLSNQVPAMAPNTQGIGVPAVPPPNVAVPLAQPLFQAVPSVQSTVPAPPAQSLFQQAPLAQATGPPDPFAQFSAPPPEEPTFFNRPELPQDPTPRPESVASRIGTRPGRGVRTTQPKLGVWGGRRKTRRRKTSGRKPHRRRHSR